MGKGQQLGIQLRQWLESGAVDLNAPQALANRWSDALGGDEGLKAPLRDLASRPLFRQVLLQRSGARRTSLEQLSRELADTYSPSVLAELIDLLEGFAQITLPRSGLPAAPPEPQRPASRGRRGRHAGLRLWQRLRPLSAGIALSAGGALVWMWCGTEADRLLFEGWGWSGGAVLVMTLALVELLLLAPPLRRWREEGLLNSELAGDSRHAWRWLSAAWVHPRRSEAVLNLIVLSVILGASALQLPDVLLRYGLTCLATLIPVALLQPVGAPCRSWGGASGAVGALIGLSVTLSLLQSRDLTYTLGPLSIPPWVLLLVVAGLQLSWQAQDRRRRNDAAQADRWGDLLASPWCWGLVFGAGWGLLTWLQQLLDTLPNSAQA